MAESIARGVVASGVLPPNRISTAVHSNLNRRDVFESFGVNVFSSSEDVSNSFFTFPFINASAGMKLIEIGDLQNDRFLKKAMLSYSL